eukprot:g4227.t1
MSKRKADDASSVMDSGEGYKIQRQISPISQPMSIASKAQLDPTALYKRAKLVLEDGSEFWGWSFGADTLGLGECVFNTGMVGYPEALTDPSYRRQILVLTYPLIGNYGVPGNEEDEHGMERYFESSKIHVSGLIVSDYSSQYSHWNAKRSLGEWLKSENVPALFGLDTRMLTKKIRERGAMLGKIVMEGGQDVEEFMDPNKLNLVAEVSCKEVKTLNAGAKPSVLCFDCGMKNNIVRYFLSKNVEVNIVPFDYDLRANPEKIAYDGIFISNGPGDPTMASATVESIKFALTQSKPIFGICLGNQILALAAGASTYKMKYGNRGMNQPCIDLRTTRCYITPQNHGYAVDSYSLPDEWQTLFVNANDMSNEGIIHTSKPFFSVQFHPEAAGGPEDTDFLFDSFMHTVKGNPSPVSLVSPTMYIRPRVHKVLLLGSGGLSIGQAGEFDYSGSQAIKALKEEGKEVILVNPNIATVQTSSGMADKVYFQPVTAKVCEKVIEKEQPDSIILSMGGQTALQVGIALHESGVLKKHNVQILGTPVDAIVATEDREVFAQKLRDIGERAAESSHATTVEMAIEAAERIGYPVLVRAAFALGGLGSGFASNREELVALAEKAFTMSDQIMIDQDLRGWKEVEYEVVRDCRDNCITVCNMENFDPLGVHTGDSIVIAPSQTLSNSEYFKLRKCAQKVVRHLGIIGECNIQYALDPNSERYCIIEVNARLSRSSALASKATGYPLAYVACKLGLGIDLPSIKNSVTKDTTACFEPSLDYCIVKIPRFDLKKFNRVSKKVGSAMKSVGEVMAIGRTFEETFQKAIRMIHPSLPGFQSPTRLGDVGKEDLEAQLKYPDHERVFAVAAALERGYSVEQVFQLTKIDRWFLSKLKRVTDMRKILSSTGSLANLSKGNMRALKTHGFSDLQIADSLGGSASELAVRMRRKALGILPWVKQIDTLAAEFPAQTNYLYMTYNGSEHDLVFNAEGIVVLGCGPYCIGSSVEFDWCAVSCVRQLRKAGYKAICVNYNPETVSTDYDESDRLYFEELSFERVMDIYEAEAAQGTVVSVGGQIAQNLALPLDRAGANVLGTSAESIDRAEDRHKFSAMLDELGVDQPSWVEFKSVAKKEMKAKCDEMGWPVLVRPSFVLSGAAMRVATCWEELNSFLSNAVGLRPDAPVVVSKFITDAKEVEFDGVANAGKILNYAISEHVENAGVHSGDATLVLPAQQLYVETIRRIKLIAGKIANRLQITGPFNIQFMARDNFVKVIECNLRSSRTFPFISKTFDFNFITLATKCMLGQAVKSHNISLLDLDYVGVKAPQFSFTRLQGADPTLGVEMASTGEVACFGKNMYEAFLLSLLAAGFKLPKTTILLAIGPQRAKENFRESAAALVRMGYKLLGTSGTHAYLKANGIPCTEVRKPSEKETEETGSAVELMRNGKVDLLVNITDAFQTDAATDGYKMRRTAVDFGVSLLSNLKCATLFVKSMEFKGGNAATTPSFDAVNITEYYRTNAFART